MGLTVRIGSPVLSIREPNGSLIARAQGSNLWYYHFDELGSARLITDSGGNVTDKYDYDAYGKLLLWHEKDAGSVHQPYQYVGQFGYYTHWQEPDFGLVQLGVRFYDAQVGRFTQRDPVHRDIQSAYAYADDSPLSGADPSGKDPTTFRCWCVSGPIWNWSVSSASAYWGAIVRDRAAVATPSTSSTTHSTPLAQEYVSLLQNDSAAISGETRSRQRMKTGVVEATRQYKVEASAVKWSMWCQT